ncbi:MAG: hypothetical protein E6J41_24155 [Chloroflexi bacterium]|nr:MAG: hypothetical protein E6J41_24155 [Chloroflexota bacterium]
MSQHPDAARPDGLRRTLVTIVLLLALGVAVLARPAPAMAAGGTARQASFTLDSVRLALRTSFLPGTGFTTSRPGDVEQVASAASFAPYRELDVVAVPFGTASLAEGLPAAAHGGAAGYLEGLAAYRRSQGATTAPAPRISLFGGATAGVVSTTPVAARTGAARPTAIVEWVAEAGSRLWIVRASSELGPGETQSSFAQSLAGMTLATAASMGRTTVAATAPPTRAAAPLAPLAPQATGDTPAWWSGTCDAGHHAGSFPLGASYLGMQACGPRPIAGGADVLVNFFPGAWGEFEWECVELSMRYLYLTFGQAPYGANGKDVVGNYPGTTLTRVTVSTWSSRATSTATGWTCTAPTSAWPRSARSPSADTRTHLARTGRGRRRVPLRASTCVQLRSHRHRHPP